MKSHVYKKNGKTVLDRNYRGRYRLDGDFTATDISLHTSDKQVAEKNSAKSSGKSSRNGPD